MATRNQRTLPGYGASPDEHHEEPGLGTWIRRNSRLLMRLFIVMVFTFGASITAASFSYGLQGEPVTLSTEQLNRGELPPGTELGDYVEVTGAPDFGSNPEQIGRPESKIGVSSRYSVAYYYFGLKETGDNLLIRTIQKPPDLTETGERVWRGKLATVGTVIFYDTTQSGLETAGLPRDESILVIETDETPELYRQRFPAYLAIIGLCGLSIAWLIWKKNKPILGL